MPALKGYACGGGFSKSIPSTRVFKLLVDLAAFVHFFSSMARWISQFQLFRGKSSRVKARLTVHPKLSALIKR